LLADLLDFFLNLTDFGGSRILEIFADFADLPCGFFVQVFCGFADQKTLEKKRKFADFL
jgi:hypothetical protein